MSNIQQTASVDANKIKTYLQTMNLANNLTNTEVQQFIEIAQAFGLNPFKREIYASKFGTSFSIIVGFETYIKRAERSGRLSGWSVTTSGSIVDPKTSDIKATITIHRKDWDQPFIHEVFFREYVQTNREGQVNKFWREKPLTMIKKVAIAQGFRLCFSDELGGMPYTADEIDSEIQMINVPVEPKQPVEEKRQAVEPGLLDTQPSDPNKRGRKPKAKVENEPKKIPDDFFSELPIDLLSSIYSQNSIDGLKDIYNENKQLQKNSEFIEALRKRRIEIESQVEVIQAKEVEVQPIVLNFDENE